MSNIYDFLLEIFKTKEKLSYILKLVFFLTAIISFLSFAFLYFAYNQYYIIGKYYHQATEFQNINQVVDFLNSKFLENFELSIFILFIIALPLDYYIFKLYELLTQNKTEILSEQEVLNIILAIILAIVICLINVNFMFNLLTLINAILSFISFYYHSFSLSSFF